MNFWDIQSRADWFEARTNYYGNQPAERNTGEKLTLQNLEVGMGS